MLKELLVLPFKPLLDAASVYPAPALLMLKVEKVATPATALTETVPPSVPLDGLVAIAMVTVALEVVTTFPFESSTSTVTAGEIDAPAGVLEGCTPNATLLAVPGVMLKVPLTAPVRPEAAAVNVYPVPVLLMVRPLNVATPFTAVMVVVPSRVPPPGLAPMASVIVLVAEVWTLLLASSIDTATAGEMAEPSGVLAGCTVNISWAAVLETIGSSQLAGALDSVG